MNKFQIASIDQIPSVQQMVKTLDQTVAGLNDIKYRLSTVLHRYMVAAAQDRDHRPPNILIIGPSGGGKTFILTHLLKSIPVIFAQASMTEYSDVGYSGRDLISMYIGLVEQKWRGEKVPKGSDEEHPWKLAEIAGMASRCSVMILDEFDKMRIQQQGPGDRQVGRQLQAELLKLVEGTEALVMRNDYDKNPVMLDTSRILHIGVGAFEGLNRIVADDLSRPTTFDVYQQAVIENIMDYGFMEELAGRFSTIIALPPLQADHLARILREQMIPAYIQEFEDIGVHCEVTDGAINALAGRATRRRIGARSLPPELEECFWRPRKDAKPGDTVRLTTEGVTSRNAEILSAIAA